MIIVRMLFPKAIQDEKEPESVSLGRYRETLKKRPQYFLEASAHPK